MRRKDPPVNAEHILHRIAYVNAVDGESYWRCELCGAVNPSWIGGCWREGKHMGKRPVHDTDSVEYRSMRALERIADCLEGLKRIADEETQRMRAIMTDDERVRAANDAIVRDLHR